jgi:hypothetical protein
MHILDLAVRRGRSGRNDVGLILESQYHSDLDAFIDLDIANSMRLRWMRLKTSTVMTKPRRAHLGTSASRAWNIILKFLLDHFNCTTIRLRAS